MKVAIKALFLELERFLIRNNKRFVIKSDSINDEYPSDLATKTIMHAEKIDHQDKRLS